MDDSCLWIIHMPVFYYYNSDGTRYVLDFHLGIRISGYNHVDKLNDYRPEC